jgi:hypothetical protein
MAPLRPDPNSWRSGSVERKVGSQSALSLIGAGGSGMTATTPAFSRRTSLTGPQLECWSPAARTARTAMDGSQAARGFGNGAWCHPGADFLEVGALCARRPW